ncbi:hypothetical protein DEU56DRAFT_906541 [Suillus clintonianus]|uniref:uncharacterized protein n=1 Tax=Suillus clintonianus TaxID=1904413 RepID=UPI001B8832B2|nr:uncharacterized protein DEU56DRAFT_906541 [Suillus clintonianus]KAG2156386.1 hypothetical protein DEU56DRAFT_906541 [Suillus clintonianus]
MNNASVQNLEEAVTIASEFIMTLDNLPSEVQFLLQELRSKETDSQEIQNDLAKEAHKYMRHSLRSDGADLTSKEKDKITTPPTEKLKDAQEKLSALSDEKIAIASRIVDLLSRKRARLEYDLGRVLVLQGETDPAAVFAGAATSTPVSVSGLGSGTAGYVLGGRNPVAQINESLRNAFAGGTAIPLASGSGSMSAVGGRASVTGEDNAFKKRRLMTAQGSIKLPSPAPSAYAPSTRGRRRRRGASSEAEDFDYDYGEETQGAEEAEEGEGEEGEDGEDKELYCFCQKLSYGEMIACDNPDCPYQWFHLPCVNLKQPLPESWFCDECIRKMGPPASGPGRKGRKK